MLWCCCKAADLVMQNVNVLMKILPSNFDGFYIVIARIIYFEHPYLFSCMNVSWNINYFILE